jgi:hypothetical protein
MHLTNREWWGIIHGMALGALFLLAFAGGLAGLYSLRPGLLTEEGISERMRRLQVGTWAMAFIAWLTAFTGTWIIYPWYRADTGTCATSVGPGCGAKFTLLSNPGTVDWHNFAMEWKEHVAWIAPLLATAVAFAVTYYGVSLVKHQGVRKALMVFFTLAFAIAGIAGAMGAFITKAAPVQ